MALCFPGCLPLPFLLLEPLQRGKDLGSDQGAPPSSPHSSEPGRTFQDKSWGADKKARLNSVFSPVLGVIMTPCCLLLSPTLPCPARPTQGALQVAASGAGQGQMGQRKLQQYPGIRG